MFRIKSKPNEWQYRICLLDINRKKIVARFQHYRVQYRRFFFALFKPFKFEKLIIN